METTNKIQKNPTMLLKRISKRFLVALALCLTASINYAQCVASFNYVDNGNGSITFTSTSTGVSPNALFAWSIVGTSPISELSLGSGSPFTWTFPNGTFDILLEVDDSTTSSCGANTTQTITITSGATCNTSAGFTFTNGPQGQVTFTSTSTGSASEFWDFGDGSVSSLGSQPSVFTTTYAANGSYNVCLTAFDATLGCQNTTCQTLVVSNITTPCNLQVGIPSAFDNGNGNFSFNFTSTGGTNPNPIINWNFGDGSPSSSVASPNHTFAANGTYNVVLTVVDDTNCFDVSTVWVTVNNVSNNPICNAGFSVYLDSLTNDVIVVNSSTGNNLTYFWEFGDGNTSTLQFPSYNYTTAGPFYLCLTVTDAANNCTSMHCDSIGSNGIVLKQTGFTINVISPVITSINENINSITDLKTYPNPFSDNLFIELNLSENAQVETYITDLLGNTVGTINSEFMNSGVHKLKWNASNLTNGVYLLNILSNESLQVKKIVLNR